MRKDFEADRALKEAFKLDLANTTLLWYDCYCVDSGSDIGEHHLLKGNLPVAEECFGRALAVNGSSHTRRLLADSLMQQNKMEDGVQHYNVVRNHSFLKPPFWAASK